MAPSALPPPPRPSPGRARRRGAGRCRRRGRRPSGGPRSRPGCGRPRPRRAARGGRAAAGRPANGRGSPAGPPRYRRHRRPPAGQQRVLVEASEVLEAAAQEPAVEMRRRPLAREEEADAPAADAGAEEDPVARVEVDRVAAAQPLRQPAQPLGGLGGLGGDHRRPRRAVLAARAGAPPRGRPARRARGAPRSRPGARPARASDSASARGEQQQLGVLPGGEQLALARPPATGGAAAGAPSITTWALMPPKPMAETPARSGWPAGQGSPRSEMRSAASGPWNQGCGSSQPVAGGITCAWTARVALIRPATPAAALVWPMFALIEPIGARRRVRRGLPAGGGQGGELGGVADRGAGAVPLEVADGLDAEAGAPVGAARASCCPSASGRVMPPWPSEEIPQPRITA